VGMWTSTCTYVRGVRGLVGAQRRTEARGASTGVYAKIRLCGGAHKQYECGVHGGGACRVCINGCTYTWGLMPLWYRFHAEVNIRTSRTPPCTYVRGVRGLMGAPWRTKARGASTGVYAKMRLCRSAHKSYDCGVHVGGAYSMYKRGYVHNINGVRTQYKRGYVHKGSLSTRIRAYGSTYAALASPGLRAACLSRQGGRAPQVDAYCGTHSGMFHKKEARRGMHDSALPGPRPGLGRPARPSGVAPGAPPTTVLEGAYWGHGCTTRPPPGPSGPGLVSGL
jgi:hypothetical protein